MVVVDNGSEDGTPELIAQRFPTVQLIREAKNTGFSAGCNAGLAATDSPYVLFLNDDSWLVEGYLERLVGALEARPDAASATGKLVYEDGGQRYIDSAGIELSRIFLSPRDRGMGELDQGQYDQAELVFGPSGTAALYRRAALHDAGERPFDEELFAYYEDVDLAWRLGRMGWRHLYVPTAVAHHRRRGAKNHPRHIRERAFVNRYVVWLKNESLVRFCMYAPVAVPWEALRLVRHARANELSLREVVSGAVRRVVARASR